MISFDSACQITLANAVRMPSEAIPLAEAFGRFLAADICADRPLPARDLSAVDGFACRRADCESDLKIVETIAAGAAPCRSIAPGECARIMTGAMVPAGADTVVMVERCAEQDGRVSVSGHGGADNIRYRAEEVGAGELLLKSGALLNPPRIALAATVGADPVTVARRPRVAVLATGSELIEPRATPTDYQIRNSNAYQLCAQIARAGGIPLYKGIVPDTQQKTREMIEGAWQECDLMLLSGGVSMGDYDYVPGVLRQLGVELLFEKVAVQPGRPTVFGVSGDKRFFGLPGNPVSTYVLFELIVRPFMVAMMGGEYYQTVVRGPLKVSMNRKKADRLSFVPVRFTPEGTIEPIVYRGSGHIAASAGGNGLVRFEPGCTHLDEGSIVECLLLEQL